MAPTPVETNVAQPSSTAAAAPEKTWNTASIVGVSIFGVFVLLFAITLTAFLIHRQRELKKLPPSHRPTSYHPFRTNSAKDGLLAHAAPTPEKDRTSDMFSRERHSSVSLYVDHDISDRRASVETSSLIPLHVSPIEGPNGQDPMDKAATSVGSGTSRGSSRFSTTSSGSLGLSTIPVPGQEPGEERRPVGSRRVSSARYYDINTAVAPQVPQIPKIVHSISP
ncbi:hypothetical protein K505DRAFT_376518 [Melanomma pulvis-pyrius CBS 109.77]|uniref:Uncharacterized protein n=1 Tax=Melanomma pulvis-pyrius CBS 109.77 TaxID=1314802 RepID=A0A6A6X6A4_9PLEO|nr:hypothetical protein K505DRAFT_376518 [Melanomma pulvis-pyrius CBS 109.77]